MLKTFRKLNKIKKILQEQKNLLEAQIFELTPYLNLTMVQVYEHHGVHNELDTRLPIFDKNVISTVKALSHVR